jgi:hypothetical protein
VLVGFFDLVELVADTRDPGFDVPFAALVVLAQPHEPGTLVAFRETRLRLGAGQLVPQLRELDLELGLPRLGALAKDLEN